jgi:hypothetical protein
VVETASKSRSTITITDPLGSEPRTCANIPIASTVAVAKALATLRRLPSDAEKKEKQNQSQREE